MAFLSPFMRSRFRIGDEMLQPRVGQLIADNGGVDFAVEKHLHHVLAGRCALHKRRVLIFGHMRIFESNPLDLTEIDAVLVRQNAFTQVPVVTV